MALPLGANTTCDIYRFGRAPPLAPDVAGVPCFLVPMFGQAKEHGEGDTPTGKYTHLLLVDVGVDVRDGYALGIFGSSYDSVWVPDKNGTGFRVAFVGRALRGTGQDHKRAYLARKQPAWPSSEV
jgi:hypothetical protein